METKLSGLIRRLRSEAGISQNRLAQLAGLNKTTIERLESGNDNPRTDNLIAILTALKLPTSEQQTVLPLLDRASAAAQLRDLWMPNAGDLYRALRGRAGLSQSQAANLFGVNKSSVSRWESGSVPNTELRERIFALYAAYPEECEALRQSKTLLNPLCADELNTLDACEQRVEELIQAMENLQWFPGDLSFLVLEAQVAKFALHSDRAKLILAKAWTFHADYLDWRNRAAERDHYLKLVMNAIETVYVPDPFWFRALGMEAKRIKDCGKGDVRIALRFQRKWLERAVHLKIDVCLLRGMACYTYEAGGHEAGERLFNLSRQAADREGKHWGIRLANLEQATHYLNDGRAAMAVPFLALDDNMDANGRLTELSVILRLMKELNETGSIREWIRKGDALFEGNDLEFRRPFWDKTKQDTLSS